MMRTFFTRSQGIPVTSQAREQEAARGGGNEIPGGWEGGMRFRVVGGGGMRFWVVGRGE